MEKKLCINCFSDEDLVALISDNDDIGECDFCGSSDVFTASFDSIADHIANRLSMFYGKAADQLPYDGREGGYQGWHVDTYDLLSDTVCLDLPNDDGGELFQALMDFIGDDTWCESDWLVLDPDQSLHFSWESFCNLVKSSRRFFFHHIGSDDFDPDARSPLQFFSQLAKLVDSQGLIKTENAGYSVVRARHKAEGEQHVSAVALGPPPAEISTQSNRMNPPGISMFYGADNPELAKAETRSQTVSIGVFTTTRAIRLLDFVNLPEIPGFFSQADSSQIFLLKFLNSFADLIVQPVVGNDRTQIDYIPTQVFTEFLRDYSFEDGAIDGVRYKSATGVTGCNVVLFATPDNVVDGSPEREYSDSRERWLQLEQVIQSPALTEIE